MNSGQQAAPWPPKCCVPAFLGSAATALCGRSGLAEENDFRCRLARLLGVRLAPGDPNPWNLEISTDNYYCGVTVEDARLRFAEIQGIIDSEVRLSLSVTKINSIAFELYEDAISDLVSSGAIVGIGFDYADFNPPRPTDHAAHIVRLSPLGSEVERQPNIFSPTFDFGYTGDIWIYDDSSEMRPEESLVNWRKLVRACRSIDGSLWSVRRE